MYKVIGDSCFIVVGFTDLCLFCFAHTLDVAYTLHTRGINAKKWRDRVTPSR